MILLPEMWHSLYEGVREDKHNTSEKKIPIFVNATDCDSVCALKVLQAIFIRNSMPYSVHVVSSQEQLQRQLLNDVGADGQDLKTAFCVNCGATTDVNELLAPFSKGTRDSLRVVFIDSHRPIHHSLNDPDNASVVILHDPEFDVDPDDIPVAEEVMEAEEQELEEGPRAQRRRVGEENSDVAQAGPSSVRARWEAETRAYYARGSHYGVPASMILFKLAHQLNMGSPFLVWMAILGVTEQMMLKRVLDSTPHHVQCMRDLHTYVAELDLGDRHQNLYGEGYESEDEDAAAHDSAGPQSMSRRARQGVIKPSTEYKFVLHRHWSLLDSLMHSPLLAARLRTFKEGSGGRGSLEVLLARTGVPLAQAQLKFSQMKVQYKDAMLPRIAEHIAMNSQKDGVPLAYESFTVDYTNRLTLSAADHVLAVSAHLEYAEGTKSCTDFQNGFWDAYKATDISAQCSCLMTGLQLAMNLHRKLLQDCNAVHQNSLVVRDAEYECLDLSDHDAWASSSPLVHPLSITRLALLVKDVWTYASHGRLQSWKARPFLLIGPPDSSGVCLVAALQGMKATKKHPVTKDVLPNSHDGERNVFGAAEGLLRGAIDESGINSARQDLFDSALLRLHKSDAHNFSVTLSNLYVERDEEVWQKESAVLPRF